MKSLLWIEDEAWAIKELMRPIVHSGTEVEIAETYTDALQKLESGKAYDVFVVDLILPLGRDEEPDVLIEAQDTHFLGISLVKDIRRRWPKAPLLVLTAVPIHTVSRALYDLGVTHILQKPILPSILRDVLLDAMKND